MDNYLDDVPDEKSFFLGEIRIKNLYGLLYEFRSMSDDTYSFYADNNHNYFADWVEFVINHKELADSLRKTKTRKESVSVLEKGIDLVKNKGQMVSPVPPKEDIVLEEPIEKGETLSDSFIVADKAKAEDSSKKKAKKLEKVKPPEIVKDDPPAVVKNDDTSKMLKDVAHDEQEIKDFLWKHFTWDMAKEFMYGMALGILIGLILSKIFFRV